MNKALFTISANAAIAPGVFRMELAGDTSAITRPGQFVNIELRGHFLRRPISVCDWSDGALTIIYKVVGRGTQTMSEMTAGQTLDALTGLGNGYDTAVSGDSPLVIGGGAGVPPLYALCKRLLEEGKRPSVILGFNTAAEVFFESGFKALGVKTTITTADGSYGQRGFVTDAVPRGGYTYFYACGPQPMLRAVSEKCQSSGQLSFEERMGCGFGACMGCSCKTKYGDKRICKDGPVLVKEEVIW